MSVIYNNVVALAKKKRMSIREVERRAGLGNGTITKWKNVSPQISKIIPVANVLGVPVTDLLEDTEEGG